MLFSRIRIQSFPIGSILVKQTIVLLVISYNRGIMKEDSKLIVVDVCIYDRTDLSNLRKHSC